MANIPVERTGGTPWWLWLLGLLLLIGLIWFLSDLFIDDEDEVDDLGEDVGVFDDGRDGEIEDDLDGDMDMDMDGPITSLAALANGAATVGRQVDLDDLRVLSLTGDSSFFAGSGPNATQGVLVVMTNMGEWRMGAEGTDGEYDVNVGNGVDIEGTIRAFDTTSPDYADIPSADRDRILQQGLYISATDLDLDKSMNQ